MDKEDDYAKKRMTVRFHFNSLDSKGHLTLLPLWIAAYTGCVHELQPKWRCGGPTAQDAEGVERDLYNDQRFHTSSHSLFWTNAFKNQLPTKGYSKLEDIRDGRAGAGPVVELSKAYHLLSNHRSLSASTHISLLPKWTISPPPPIRGCANMQLSQFALSMCGHHCLRIKQNFWRRWAVSWTPDHLTQR